MIPGAGWVSAGPGYRHWYAKDRVFVDASTAVSWRGYKTAQARFELPKIARSRLALGSQVRWQDFTQLGFFGEGAEAAHFVPLADSRVVVALRGCDLAHDCLRSQVGVPIDDLRFFARRAHNHNASR